MIVCFQKVHRRNILIKYSSKILGISLLALSLMQGCAALLVGAGVGAASAAHDRRTLGTQLDDKTIASRISIALSENEAIEKQANINVHVFNGSVLLVGQAPNESLIRQAQQLAESINNVEKLHNQVRLAKPISASTTTHDVWLASKIKAKLIADKRVDGFHIHVAVENSEVFLMGLVSTNEADSAANSARNVDGVTQVIKAFEYL
ncbi:MAG: osmotically-inducible protein OsmY [Paraglaciecola sp.]|jgi:osmotically-inducible protein OsmY